MAELVAKHAAWSAFVNAEETSRLNQLRISIEAELMNANSLAQQALEKYLAVGLHLREARLMFPGDKEFGAWRKDAVPGIGSKWANDLMLVAEKFADRLLTQSPDADSQALRQLPVSTLRQLVPADDRTISDVAAEVREGTLITKSDARARARGSGPAPEPAAAPPRGSGRPAGGSPAPDAPAAARGLSAVLGKMAAPPVEDDSITNRVGRVLDLPTDSRIKRAAEFEDLAPYIILGINPFCDGIPMNRELLCRHAELLMDDEKRHEKTIAAAHKAVVNNHWYEGE